MKKLNSKLFEKKEVLKKVNMENLVGGSNSSDVTYNDSKQDGGGYDIAVQSLIDTIDSSRSLDKPTP